MSSHCNSYGFSAGFAAILTAISWYLVQERSCKVNLANFFNDNLKTDHLQLFHYIAIVVGAIIFVLSFFDFANVLYEIKLLFVLAVLGIFASGLMTGYASWMAFNMSCKSAMNNLFDTASIGGAKNVFEAGDEVGISIFLLDIIAALLLLSAAISFSRTY